MSSRKGIVCGLTGEIADFEDECPDYVLDAEHQQELEKQKKKQSFTYEGAVSYSVPKSVRSKWNSPVLLLPFIFLGAHFLSFLGIERNYASGLFLWIIIVLFTTYIITAGFYRKHPIPSITISTILSFIVSSFFSVGVIQYSGPHLMIPVVMFFSYFFILSELHMYKQIS